MPWGETMLVFAKKPIVTAVSFVLFTLLLLSYQNCAKPLDEIGMNSSMSGIGSCQISPSKAQVVLNENQAIAFTYSPASLKIRIVVMNNSSGVFSENVYSVSGVLDVTYINSSQAGNYTVHGIVETEDGATAGTCTTTFQVKGPPIIGGPNPPQTTTYAWSAGAWGACSATACGTSGTQIRAVSCKLNDTNVMADSYCSSAGAKPTTSQSCSTPSCGGGGPIGDDGCKAAGVCQ